jgi:hypothetical protein
MSSRALALALAVGLGAVLVGLSVAPRVLPGDTLRLRPRVATGATVDVRGPDGAIAHVSVGDAVSLFAVGMAAVLPASSALLLGGLVLLAVRRPRRRITASTLPATGCRGPPPRS